VHIAERVLYPDCVEKGFCCTSSMVCGFSGLVYPSTNQAQGECTRNITEHNLFEESVVHTLELQVLTHKSSQMTQFTCTVLITHISTRISFKKREDNKDAILITESGCAEVNFGTF